MSKQPYFTTTVSTKRITAVAGTDNQDWQTSLASVLCNLQPLDDSFNEDLDGSYGKYYLMFCNPCDIIEGDKVISGTDEYLVKGIRDYAIMSYSILEVKLRKTQ